MADQQVVDQPQLETQQQVEQAPEVDAAVDASLVSDELVTPEEAVPFEGAPEATGEPVATQNDDGSGDSQPSPDDEIRRYQDMLAQERAEKEELRTRQAEVDRQSRELRAQQARQEWDALQQQAETHAQTLSPEDGFRFMSDFYGKREHAMLEVAQQQVEQARLPLYRQHVIETYDLTADDAALLGGDPNQWEPVAAGIQQRNQASNERIGKLESEIQQLKRSQQSQARQQSGVDRSGGIGGQPLPRQLEDLSPREHFRELLRQSGDPAFQ